MGNTESGETFNLSYSKCDRRSTCGESDKDLNTIPNLLRFHSQHRPDDEAIIFTKTDGSREVVTFRDVFKHSNNMAKSFLKLGVKKYEIVAVNLRDSSEWLYAVFGAMMAGARPVSLSFTYTDGSDIIAMMKKLQACSTMVLDPGSDEADWRIFNKLVLYFDDKGNVKSEKIPFLRYLIFNNRPDSNKGALTLKEMLAWENTEVVLPELDPSDIAILLQTSGSTGIPKVVAHTHASFLSPMGLLTSDDLNDRHVPSGKHFNDRPFGWLGGFPVTIITGQTRVTRSGLCEAPEDVVGSIIDAVKRENCTIMSVLPPLLSSLMDRQDEHGDDWPVETIGTGGQPMSKQFARCVGKLCKGAVISYGSTEVIISSICVVYDPDAYLEHSIGKPIPGIEMKIVDKNEEIVPVNTSGEIYVKSQFLFKEYFNDPDATKACFTEDGWFRTDDIGFMNENGTFFCEARKSEMMICGGMNVAPSILETTIEKCPGVAHVICVPVPHDTLFQVVCACIILENGSDLTEDYLRTYCEEVHNDKPRLFTVLPTYYMFMAKFPKTYTGKISRKELAEYAIERFCTNLYS